MSYAMCLDNSWDVMCEEEMYDVNGGWNVAMSGFIRFRVGFIKISVPTSVTLTFSGADAAWVVGSGIAAIAAFAVAANVLIGAGQITSALIIKSGAAIIVAAAQFLTVCTATNDYVQKMTFTIGF